jgi:hypothetical protein
MLATQDAIVPNMPKRDIFNKKAFSGRSARIATTPIFEIVNF